ncbi:Ohr family peroxiredoxin [Nocardioides zeae]|uniref:Osmotically inducible protein OsmC n=1 Tax=Nocardioides zeae TaxID=1457234 RepID=A0AAJ1U3G1_9ACTN|nr:Ohr family peroxiredoxin [Nocardioides zeae]MDQ1103781.1 osmotically inducible protein OsmC [Nocardioides zeae]
MSTMSYTATARAEGDGRNGHVRTADGLVDLDLGIPSEIGGAGGAVSNPEMLFAAGYAGCFLSALHSVARAQRVKIPGADVEALVTIAAGEAGFGLSVELVATLPGVSDEAAEQLLAAAHAKCPYSRAVTGNIPVELRRG